MEDRDSLLKDAKSFLGKYSYLSPEDQKIALSAKHPRDLARLAEDNEGLFRGLQAFRKLEAEGAISLPQSADSKNTSSAVSGTVSGAIAGAGVIAATGISDLFKDKSYDGYKKSVQKNAEEAAKAWEKEEEKLRKENEKLIAQGKKPKERDPDRFTSKEEYIVNHLNTSRDNLAFSDPKKARKWAQEHPEDLQLSKAIDRSQMWNKKLTFEEFEKIRNSYIEKSSQAGASPSEIAKLQAKANSELNNLLIRANPELAKSWAIQHGDRGLAVAHNASRQRQVDYAKKNQGRISKFLGRDPAKKFGNEIKLPEPPKPPIATRMTQMAAAGAAVSAPSGGDAAWGRSEPITLPPPMPIPTAIPNTSQPAPNASSSFPPQRGTQSPRGRGTSSVASKAKKVAGAAALASRLAAGDPKAWLKVILKYALPLIISFLIFFLVIILYLWVNACSIASQVPWGQDLLKAFGGVNCDFSNPDEGTGDFVPEPPPGFTIIKSAPEASEPGNPIEYSIDISYDPSKADPNLPLEDMTLIDLPDFTFTNPQSPDDFIRDEQYIKWRLSDLISNTNKKHTYKLKVTPSITGLLKNSAWIETPNGTGSQPKKCKGDLKQCLKDEFNFIVTGAPPDAFLLDVYTLYSEIAVATKYKSLLKAGGPTYFSFENGSDGGCPGQVKNTDVGPKLLTTFVLTNYTLTGCSRQTRKSRLIHESGHIIKNASDAKYEFYKNNIYNKDGGCYYQDNSFTRPFFLNTYDVGYGASKGRDLQGENESFADSIADYVIPQTKGGKTYLNDCPKAYEFIKNTIFNNYSFK